MSSVSLRNSSFKAEIDFFIKFRIEIIDSGVGISEENLKRLF